jgi:hypothetical protein
MVNEPKQNPLKKKLDVERIKAIVVIFISFMGLTLAVYHWNSSYSNVKGWITSKKKEYRENLYRYNPEKAAQLKAEEAQE